MEIVLIGPGLIFLLWLVFDGNEKPSELPPFTKEEAEEFWRNFDYWNKR